MPNESVPTICSADFLQIQCQKTTKGAFRLCNYVSNFLVAREKLLRKLQARAIFRTRRGWIFIAWIFIARNFIAQRVLDFH